MIFYERRKQKQNVLVICRDADIWGSPSLNAAREGKMSEFVVSASLSPSVGHDHSTGEVDFEARLQLVSLTHVLPNDNHFWEQEGINWGLAVL